jgi:WD40 repeat protein
MAVSRDGALVAVARDDGQVQLLETVSGKLLGKPLRIEAGIRAVAFDWSNQRLVTGYSNGNAEVWDLARKRVIVTVSHQHEIRCAVFRPGDDAFATTCGDGTARLWSSATGQPMGEPLIHGAGVDRLTFQPDGTLLVTTSLDGSIRLWCARTGLPIGPALEHGEGIQVVLFSPDGRRLATSGRDVRCWKMPNPADGSVEGVSCWVRVETELDFDAGDAIRHLDGTRGWELRRRLTELGGSPFR